MQKKYQALPQPALIPAEAAIILDKKTEIAFSGAYLQEKRMGTYYCRQCGEALFVADDKFDSGCGWPSFDGTLPGKVKELPDADGHRTEIVCANCAGHLGHVFRGENFTVKDTRHCVNSASVVFVPGDPTVTEVAIFAGGCFWGIEHMFASQPGVLEAESGYTGGKVVMPTYEGVCGGTTGHAEAVRVVFDPSKISYETLAKYFFTIHDPTQINRQGPDIGTQYRSAVFYTNEKQARIAAELMGILKKRGYEVVTEVKAAGPFYPAEPYHQDFFVKNPARAFCHAPENRFGE